MTEVIIREATTDDLTQILRLLSQPDMSGNDIPGEEEASRIYAQIRNSTSQRIYVAESAEGILGTFTLVIVQHLSHHGARSAVLEDVVVKDGQQGHGIGRRMMRFAAELARSEGCYKLALSSGIRRENAHEFYESLGFERHGYSFSLQL